MNDNTIYTIKGITSSENINKLISKEITTISFQNKIKDIYKVLNSNDYNDKFIISMYILFILYEYIRISRENKELILKILLDGLNYNNNNDEITKHIIKSHIISHLSYIKDVYIKKEIYINIYNNDSLIETIDDRIMIQILQYILFNINSFPNILIDDVIIKLRNIFVNTHVIYHKMHIADIVLNAGYKEIGNELLDLVRQEQERERERERERYIHDGVINTEPVANTEPIKNVYNDTQNVHNSVVNNSVLLTCNKLIEDRQMSKFDFDNVFEVIITTMIENKNDFMTIIMNDCKRIYGYSNELANNKLTDEYTYEIMTKSNIFIKYKDEIDILKKSKCNYLYDILFILYKTIKNIKNDITFFTCEIKNNVKKFTLENIFSNVLDFILNHNNKDELLHRLIQELIEMYNYCSTGYMSRLINTIQSFTEIYTINIITDYMRTKTFIYNVIKKYVDDNSDIIDDFIELTPIFNRIIYEHINNNINEYIKEGHSGEDISKAMCEVIGRDKFRYNMNTLIYTDEVD